MNSGIIARLRGVKRIEIYGLIIIASVVILVALNGQTDGNDKGSSLEARLEGILSCVDNVKNVKAMITQTDAGDIIGVLVVAEGNKDLKTYLEIQSAIRTLLDVELSQIRIIQR